MLKINFALSIGLERFKIWKPLWAFLGMPDHTHPKLHDHFVASMDVSLHAKNQYYTSYCF